MNEEFPNDFSQLLPLNHPTQHGSPYSRLCRLIQSKKPILMPPLDGWIHPKQIQISVMAQTPDFRTSMPAAKQVHQCYTVK